MLYFLIFVCMMVCVRAAACSSLLACGAGVDGTGDHRVDPSHSCAVFVRGEILQVSFQLLGQFGHTKSGVARHPVPSSWFWDA